VKSTTAPATVGYDESFKKPLGILPGKEKDEEDYESGDLPFCSRLILGGRIENLVQILVHLCSTILFAALYYERRFFYVSYTSRRI